MATPHIDPTKLFPFSPISAEEFAAIRHDWLSVVAKQHGTDSAARVDLESVFTRIEQGQFKTLSDGFNISCFYKVKIEDTGIMSIVEMIPTKKGGAVWIKMMDIYVSP